MAEPITPAEVAAEFVAAFGERDEDRMVATLHPDAVLDGPFPIGKKTGPAKAAKALLNVGKLGVKLGDPTPTDGVLQSTVTSPAGSMILKFTVEGEHITRLDVDKP